MAGTYDRRLMMEETRLVMNFVSLSGGATDLNGDVDILSNNISVSQENLWALEWLWDDLSFSTERLTSFMQEVTQEMEHATGVCGHLLFINNDPFSGC